MKDFEASDNLYYTQTSLLPCIVLKLDAGCRTVFTTAVSCQVPLRCTRCGTQKSQQESNQSTINKARARVQLIYIYYIDTGTLLRDDGRNNAAILVPVVSCKNRWYVCKNRRQFLSKFILWYSLLSLPVHGSTSAHARHWLDHPIVLLQPKPLQ